MSVCRFVYCYCSLNEALWFPLLGLVADFDIRVFGFNGDCDSVVCVFICDDESKFIDAYFAVAVGIDVFGKEYSEMGNFFHFSRKELVREYKTEGV